MARSSSIGSEHVLLTVGVVVVAIYVYHRYHGAGRTR
jgi:hypothetical protein